MPRDDAPLSGIRIVSVTEYGAGPFATRLFADLGADVIKIENPRTGGDSGRRLSPFAADGDSLFFQTLNRNSRSVAIDLKTTDGREAFDRVAGSAHAVFNNLRAGAAMRLGLTHSSLGRVKPALVCCSLSGWGMTGPRVDDPAYDYAIQAFGGHMSLTGAPGGPPTRAATPWTDTSGAMAAAFGMLAGIVAARETGKGGDVEISMLHVSLAQWMYLPTWYLTERYVPERVEDSAHPSVVPAQLFDVRDGHIIVLCQTDEFWRTLCYVVGLPDLVDDARFATMRARLEHKRELIAILSELFLTRDAEHWLGLLRGRVPIERVNTFAEAMSAFEEMWPSAIDSCDHEQFGTIRMVGNPIRSPRWAAQVERAPRLGEHTREVLMEAGMSMAELEALERRGAIATPARGDG